MGLFGSCRPNSQLALLTTSACDWDAFLSTSEYTRFFSRDEAFRMKSENVVDVRFVLFMIFMIFTLGCGKLFFKLDATIFLRHMIVNPVHIILVDFVRSVIVFE